MDTIDYIYNYIHDYSTDSYDNIMKFIMKPTVINCLQQKFREIEKSIDNQKIKNSHRKLLSAFLISNNPKQTFYKQQLNKSELDLQKIAKQLIELFKTTLITKHKLIYKNFYQYFYFFCKKLDEWKITDKQITKQKCQESIQLLQSIQTKNKSISKNTQEEYKKPINEIQKQLKNTINKLDQ